MRKGKNAIKTRQQRALNHLNTQLSIRKKPMKVNGKINVKQTSLSDHDIYRIESEITTLKKRV